MKPIQCLIVDDEDLALDILEMYLERLDRFEMVGRFSNVLEANCFLQCHPVDLIFLDIQMPKINGMEWVKSMSRFPKVIFCTAFDHYAVESYEVNAVDYLLKPISFERFKIAVRKVADLIDAESPSNKTEEHLEKDYISVRSERKLFKIPVSDILYFHSLSNYYKIVTSTRKITAYGSLSELESKLSTDQFIRIHRSYLVAINKIEAVSSSFVYLQGKLPIGRSYRSKVEALYKKSPLSCEKTDL